MSDLKDKIKKWLDEQGYPLEMEVSAKLLRNDFLVTQSKLYDDPDTDIKREIDIVASISDRTGFLELVLVVECKKDNKPWIVFTSKDTLTTYNPHHTFGFKTKFARKIMLNHDVIDYKEMREKIPWYWMQDERIGYNIAQAFNKGRDNTFKAQMSALKAAYNLKENEDDGFECIKIFFPILVLDGELFECYLNKNGESVLSQSDRLFLQSTYYQNNLEGVNLQICKKDNFEEIIDDLKCMLDYMNNKFREDILKLSK